MKSYARSHLADDTLMRSVVANTATVRHATADQLADIGEVDARKLYLPAGYPSMFAFCMHELHMTEAAAFRRIHVARKARRFPAIFHAVADGRLHLTAALLLSPHLREDNAEELLAAATHKSKAEVERLLAERFPRPDLPTVLMPVPAPRPSLEVVATTAPQRAELALEQVDASSIPGPAAGPATPLTPPTAAPAPRPRLTPLAPGRFAFQVTIDQETHDLLRYAQTLLSHAMPPSDLAAVLKRVVAEGVARLERQRFAATEHPRCGGRRASAESRHVPAEVKRAVWKRDGGRCTFVSDTGVRCPAIAWLQFDHVDPYAHGGEATAANIRLRCHGHNQFDAERTFGAEFMSRKRKAAQCRAKQSRARTMDASALP
jgi:hypothetical protein